MRINKNKLVILIFIIIGVYFSFEKKYILLIEDRTHSKEYEYVLEDDKFIIGYKHSVMKTPVEEVFIPTKDNKINLVETTYKSYGVGLPFLPEEGEMEIKDGNFILKINRVFNDITFGVSPISKHYLKVNDTTYNMMELLGNEPTKIKVKILEKIKFIR